MLTGDQANLVVVPNRSLGGRLLVYAQKSDRGGHHDVDGNEQARRRTRGEDEGGPAVAGADELPCRDDADAVARRGPHRVPRPWTACSSSTIRRIRQSGCSGRTATRCGGASNGSRRRGCGLIVVFLIRRRCWGQRRVMEESSRPCGSSAPKWPGPGAGDPQGDPQRQIPSGPTGTVWMMARWTAPDGQARRGWISVTPGDAAGGSVRSGHPSDSLTWPLLRHSQVERMSYWPNGWQCSCWDFCCALAGAGASPVAGVVADWNRAWCSRATVYPGTLGCDQPSRTRR